MTSAENRTYRDVSRVGSAVDADRPEWAEGLAVGDEITFDSPAGQFQEHLLGFSMLEDYEGQPVVSTPPDLYEYFNNQYGLIVLQPHDIIAVNDQEVDFDA